MLGFRGAVHGQAAGGLRAGPLDGLRQRRASTEAPADWRRRGARVVRPRGSPEMADGFSGPDVPAKREP